MVFTLDKDTPLSKELLRKILNKNNTELARYNRLYRYYLGENDILGRVMKDDTKPNNKIAHPYATYITDTLVGYFMGEPISYMSLDEDALDALMNTLMYNDEHSEDMEVARDCSIYGNAYEILYVDDKGAIRFTKVNPQEMIIVYDDTIEKNILYAIRYTQNYDVAKDTTHYSITVYDKEFIRSYSAGATLSSFSLVEEVPHYFGDVPVVEYLNNKDRTGDFEKVISLIDAYDIMESDSLNDYESFVDAYLVLKGMTADKEEISNMRENRVLLLDEDSSAEWLIKNENGTVNTDNKNRLSKDIHKFSKVPDLSDENFASNSSGVAIKYKLFGTETLTGTKESNFRKGLQRRIRLIYNMANFIGNTSYDYLAIEIQFARNIPSNDTELAQVVSTLSPIVSRETLLAQLPFIDDVGAEMDRLERDKQNNPFYDISVEELLEDNEPEVNS